MSPSVVWLCTAPTLCVRSCLFVSGERPGGNQEANQAMMLGDKRDDKWAP